MPQVELVGGRTTLAMLPNKFNKKLWIRKGGYVIVEEEEKAAADSKVSGLIISILYDEHIKQLKKRGEWPDEFSSDAREGKQLSSERDEGEALEGSGEGEEDEDLPPLHKNTNRRQIVHELESDVSE
jgi:probable RNA-binding protein EIF1AD